MNKCKWHVTNKNSFWWIERECGHNTKFMRAGKPYSPIDTCPYCKKPTKIIMEDSNA